MSWNLEDKSESGRRDMYSLFGFPSPVFFLSLSGLRLCAHWMASVEYSMGVSLASGLSFPMRHANRKWEGWWERNRRFYLLSPFNDIASLSVVSFPGYSSCQAAPPYCSEFWFSAGPRLFGPRGIKISEHLTNLFLATIFFFKWMFIAFRDQERGR